MLPKHTDEVCPDLCAPDTLGNYQRYSIFTITTAAVPKAAGRFMAACYDGPQDPADLTIELQLTHAAVVIRQPHHC